MSKTSYAFILCIGMAILPGCSSHRYIVNDPVTRPMGNFATVEVGSFTTNVNNDAARNLAAILPQRIATTLQEEKHRKTKKPLFEKVTTSQDDQGNVLSLTGTIISLEEGSRAKRYLVGFGSGKAFTTVECLFIDKSTGSKIARATFDGELSMGFFGGSSDEATQGVLEAIVQYITDNY